MNDSARSRDTTMRGRALVVLAIVTGCLSLAAIAMAFTVGSPGEAVALNVETAVLATVPDPEPE